MALDYRYQIQSVYEPTINRQVNFSHFPLVFYILKGMNVWIFLRSGKEIWKV